MWERISAFSTLCTQFPHCAHSTKNIPWNQLFSNFFSKDVDLTKKIIIFLKNGADRVFDDFSTLCVGFWNTVHSVENAEILSQTFFAKISWKQFFYKRNY